SKLVAFVGVVDRIDSIVRPLPKIADVIVVVDHHHDPIVLVLDRQEIGLSSVVRLFDIERLYRIETVEYRMCDIEFLHLEFRKSSLNIVHEVLHLPRIPEVIYENETAA